jgi:hypothetical protein
MQSEKECTGVWLSETMVTEVLRPVFLFLPPLILDR